MGSYGLTIPNVISCVTCFFSYYIFRSLFPQIEHVVKGHAAYTRLQEQAHQRSADALSAAPPKMLQHSCHPHQLAGGVKYYK